MSGPTSGHGVLGALPRSYEVTPDDPRPTASNTAKAAQAPTADSLKESQLAAGRGASTSRRTSPTGEITTASLQAAAPVATSVATSRSSIASDASRFSDVLHAMNASDGSDTRVTRLRAWSGITGWRFESSSAHLSKAPLPRGFRRSEPPSRDGGASRRPISSNEMTGFGREASAKPTAPERAAWRG